jgi:hypothetical protein
VLGASATAASLDPRAMGAATMATARDASAASGITLAGLTSQNYPTFFKVSANGRSLAVGAIALDMTCTSGAEFVLEDAVVRTRIARGGALHVGFALPPTAGSNGATYTATDSLRAHLNGKHSQLTGVWQLQVDYSFTNGMSDRCDSGPVRFAASG